MNYKIYGSKSYNDINSYGTDADYYYKYDYNEDRYREESYPFNSAEAEAYLQYQIARQKQIEMQSNRSMTNYNYSKNETPSKNEIPSRLPDPTGTPIQQRVLAERVIRLFKDNGYPCGFYVLNKIAGNNDSSNLEIFMPRSNATGWKQIGVNEILSKLKTVGYVPTLCGTTTKATKNITVQKLVINVYNPNTYSSINFVVDRSISGDSDTPFNDIGSDVLSIYETKEGEYKLSGKAIATGCEISHVVENIENKKFQVLKDSFNISFDKEYGDLLKLGFKQITSFDKIIEADKLDKVSKQTLAEMSGIINSNEPGWMAQQLKDITATNICGESEKISQEPTQLKPGWSIQDKTNTALDVFKNEMNMAAYRSASFQITKLAKSNIISYLKANETEQNKLDLIAELLDTAAGTAIVSAMLGISLPYAPKIGDDPRINKLADEFRIAAYSVAMDAVFSALMQYIAPEIIKAMKTLPPIENQRIAIETLPQIVEEDELIEDEIEQENLTVSL